MRFRTPDTFELYSGTPPTDIIKMTVAKVAEAQNAKTTWSAKCYGKIRTPGGRYIAITRHLKSIFQC